MRHVESYLVDTIAEIKQMVTVLITLNKRLKKRVLELEQQKQEWSEERCALEDKLQRLQADYDILKLAKTIQEKDDTGEAKMQISKLMREIDQCMVLIQNL